MMMLQLEVESTHFMSAILAKLSELSGIRPTAIDCDGPNVSEIDIREILEPTEQETMIKDAISKISKSIFAKDVPLKLENQFMVII